MCGPTRVQRTLKKCTRDPGVYRVYIPIIHYSIFLIFIMLSRMKRLSFSCLFGGKLGLRGFAERERIKISKYHMTNISPHGASLRNVVEGFGGRLAWSVSLPVPYAVEYCCYVQSYRPIDPLL